jgi:hypothetical protein
VTTDTSIDELASAPISELIPRAMEGRKRAWGTFRQYDPYAGLCEKRPVRLLAALTYELCEGKDVTEAWTLLLHSGARRNDKPKMAGLIARRLAALPRDLLEAIVMPASYWLEVAHKQLFLHNRGILEELFDELTDALSRAKSHAPPLKPAAAREIRDFLNASSGSAAGHLAYVLFEDPSVAELPPGEPLPTNWLARGERLLTLPDDHGRFSLVSFARNLGWLHNHAAAWSEEHVVAVLLRHGASRDAALAGFFLNPTVWDAQLYRQLKPLLIEIGVAVHQSHLRDIHALGTFFVRGWLTRDHDGARWLTDEEFRRILLYGGDDLRPSRPTASRPECRAKHSRRART